MQKIFTIFPCEAEGADIGNPKPCNDAGEIFLFSLSELALHQRILRPIQENGKAPHVMVVLSLAKKRGEN